MVPGRKQHRPHERARIWLPVWGSCLAGWVAAVGCTTPKDRGSSPPVRTASGTVQNPSGPRFEDPCAQVGICLDRAQDVAQSSPRAAETAVQDCLRCPNEAAYRFWADLLKGRGALEEARRVLLEGREEFPRSTSMLLALARVEQLAGRPHAAIAHLASARRLQPGDPLLESEHQRLVLKHGGPEARAEAALQEWLKVAAGRYALDDLTGTLNALDRAEDVVAAVPRLKAVVRHRRALVFLGRGDPEAARREAALGLSLESVTPDTEAALHLTQGEAHLMLGDYGQARDANARAVEQAPQDPLAWANLAFSELHLGRARQASEAFVRAVDRGLARRLTYAQLQKALPTPDFLQRPEVVRAVRRGWPGAREP